MSIYAELSYQNQKVEIQEVKGIQFSVLSPDEIIRRSVGKITRNDVSSENVEHLANSLSSTKMGASQNNPICSTCGLKSSLCNNHHGHIELAKPCFNCCYHNITRKILKCVCYRCSRILISPLTQHEDLKNDMAKIMAIKNNQKRFEAYFKLCNTTTKIKLCGDDKHIGCGSRQPDRYNKEAAMKIIAEWKDKTKETSTQLEFTAEDVLRIFKRITNEDMEVMGFNPTWNRPEWMILTVLPVPPPAVRPSIIEENGQRREDDLTHKLSDIIKTNNNILDKINKGASEETIKLITMVLQYHVFTLMDNQIPGLAPSQQRNGRKLKSICDRMRKKDGRIRGNLNGKRVDQSARSVITPDPFISIDELGVPIKIALNITFQEVVNEYNIDEMKRLILNGPDVWPGAKYIRKGSDMITINLKYADLNKIVNEIKFGDVVHRHLRNGDYVLFNRQPSLHKMSMMCHKVIIMPYQTFRLNVLDTPPYNADFDGDEMNLHCPQNIQTMFELKDLASVPYLILTQKDGKPSIEVVQDTLVGSFRLTKDYTIVGDKQMANLQMCNSYFKGKLEKPSKDYTYTGKELFSEILPPALYIEEKNKAGDKVIIHNSKLIKGNLDKAVFHNITNGLIPVIYHDYGPIEIKKFLDNTQRLVCRWLLTAGFSIGISDLVTDKKTETELIGKIKEMKANAYKKLDDMRKGTLENNSIFNNEDFIERELIGILNETTSIVAKISLANIDEKTNRMFNMVKSGSKGKETNIAQIMACVGQQNVDGKRIAYGFTDRTLPHFTKYDDGPEARGFVENSFIAGLAPHEVFFHAMGGREGLIDTAVKTSSTGYAQRKLVKAMEDAKINYDNTVRNANGTIVQFIYGEDGMDGCKIENQFLPTIEMSYMKMEEEYNLTPIDKIENYLIDDVKKEINLDTYKRCKNHFLRLVDDKMFMIVKVNNYNKNSKIKYPIPFNRIITTAIKRRDELGIKGVLTDLTPDYILDKIDMIINELFIKDINDKNFNDDIFINDPEYLEEFKNGKIFTKQSMMFFHILLRCYLSPKKMIIKNNFSKELFDWVIKQIYEYFYEALAPPSEMVGVVAAQTIGEMGTQMTLDSFHVSGTAAAVKATSGVPRLNEILSATKKTKTPTLIIHMKPDVASVINPKVSDDGINYDDDRVNIETKDKAMKVKNSLEITKLADILESSEIYWDTGIGTSIEEDKKLLEIYDKFRPLYEAVNKNHSRSNWVLRMKFNKEKIIANGLRMIDIYTKLNKIYNKYIDCVYSDDNAEECIFRVRLTEFACKDIENKDEIAAIKAMEHNIVYQVLLKGYKGINKVSLNKMKYDKFNKEKGDFDKVVEWVLDTDGTNLMEILANPNIDSTRTISNDIREIYNVLGVEAARSALAVELTNVIGEGAMNYRHLSLLIDTMTFKGGLMSIDRHGINRNASSALSKSSFEESVDMLINASIFSEYDNTSGISPQVMLGKVANCGTGNFDIILDEEYMMELMKNTNIKRKNKYNMEEIAEDDEDDEDCMAENIAFDYNIKNKDECYKIKKQDINII
jgi:DNA-directed RNA polymerase II subunit RPB1